MTHWAFGQVAQRAGAPAGYLRELPAEIAAACLRHGLAQHAEGTAALMFHRNGGLVLRSVTSPSYTRIWNYEITGRLLDLVQRESGWRVPPARPAFELQPGTRLATEEDVLEASDFGLSIAVGDLIAPAGLYASDHDMFAFLVNESRRIEDGTDGGLSRGFFVWNSEVGDAAFGIMTFLYRHVCGNHIVWGAKDVREVRIRHVGRANERAFQQLAADLREYANSSVSDDEAKIQRARTFELGDSKDAVLDRLFGLRSLNLTRKALEEAYESAEQHPEDGSPRSAWGMAQGLTRDAQKSPYADQRVKRDRAAGKVLEIVF